MRTRQHVDEDCDREPVVHLSANVDGVDPGDEVHHCCRDPPEQVWRPLRIFSCSLRASGRCQRRDLRIRPKRCTACRRKLIAR